MPSVVVSPIGHDLAVLVLAALDERQVAAVAASPFGPFVLLQGADALAALREPGMPDVDAVLVSADADEATLRWAERVAADTATLVVARDEAGCDPGFLLHWLERGVEDVLLPAESAGATLGRRLRAAIERKRIDRSRRRSYATDLDTGLPHQQQLIEHMSHLLALREREPSPMAVLVLRVEGLATVEARFGREAASALRRKAGVRLRAGIRASDVVASLGEDSFGVLLGAMLVPDDAGRVGAKLLAATIQPFGIAGAEVALAAALGIAQYPEDGAQPEQLLRRAVGLAASASAQGRLGHANFAERGGEPASAANDD